MIILYVDQIKSLRAKISAQEATVNQQESELRHIRAQLSDLQKEKTQLEQRLEAEKQQQANVERSVKAAQNEIEKVSRTVPFIISFQFKWLQIKQHQQVMKK